MSKIMNIHDIAKAAGVSVATVSRVLNGSPKVHPDTRRKVQQLLDQHRYIPNMNGISLLKNRSYTFALIIPDITNPFFTTVARGFQDKAQRAGWSVVLGNTDEDFATEKAFVNAMLVRRVDGVAIAPVGHASMESLKLIQHYGIPLVLIDREVEGFHTDVVRSDDRKGTELLTKHLLNLGHQKIAIITGPENVSTQDIRSATFLRVCRNSGVNVRSEYICRAPLHLGPARRAATHLLKTDPRPTAIVAANNFLAIGCIRAARSMGIRVPEDLAVVSFDDIGPASLLQPFLTVVAQPARRMGALAAKMLLDRVENKGDLPAQTRIFSPRLIIRASCGALQKQQVIS